MAQMRRENMRIIGQPAARAFTREAGPNMANMTPEQKAQRQADTQKSYEAWVEARRARLQRPRLLR